MRGPTAPTFEGIQPRIKALLKDKILVGHAVFNDLCVSPESQMGPQIPLHHPPCLLLSSHLSSNFTSDDIFH